MREEWGLFGGHLGTTRGSKAKLQSQRAERNFKQVSPAPPAGWEQGGLYIYQALALGKVEQGWPGLLLKYY